MNDLIVSIDKEVSWYITPKGEKINIYSLFNTFWVDLHFLLKEKKYNNSFINNLEKWNYITSDTF